jgi:hypothetical protein
MSSLTTEQVAELLLGIARSQLAMVDAIESMKPGFKATHLRSNVESAARIKMNRPEALVDFPSRLLLQMLGRNTPTQTAVVADLQALLSERTAVESAISLDMSSSLDMTK